MLNLFTDRKYRDCEGTSRREFIKIGTLGMGAMTLPGLLAARAQAKALGREVKDTSVVWVWLGGGPTHVETFDPKMSAPSEYRSVTGEVTTNVAGITLGGNFSKCAKVADKMAFVRSFAHTNSGHGGGTHFVMTGYDNRLADNGGLATRPSMGSIVARVRGANNDQTGMPTYVRLGGVGFDGPAFLGSAFAPFNPSGDARNNMTVGIPESRLADRRELLKGVDRVNRQVDQTGLMDGLDKFEQQAFHLVLGSATKAFDLTGEDPKVVERYGSGGGGRNGNGSLGQQLLRARRLCEAGCGFVTVSYGGWDMHGQIKQAMDQRGPQLDHALATFVADCCERGLDKNILLVVTGEFGRTPKVNRNAGRDHWAPLSTLALAGGGLTMGCTVGESAPKVDVPKSTPIRPQDLMATVFHVLGIDPQVQFVSNSGRPTYMVEDGKVIEELV